METFILSELRPELQPEPETLLENQLPKIPACYQFCDKLKCGKKETCKDFSIYFPFKTFKKKKNPSKKETDISICVPKKNIVNSK